jgi:hypothetical protein
MVSTKNKSAVKVTDRVRILTENITFVQAVGSNDYDVVSIHTSLSRASIDDEPVTRILRSALPLHSQ